MTDASEEARMMFAADYKPETVKTEPTLDRERDVFATADVLKNRGYDYAAGLLLGEWRRAKKFRAEAHLLTEERDQAVTQLASKDERITAQEDIIRRYRKALEMLYNHASVATNTLSALLVKNVTGHALNSSDAEGQNVR